jgi:hypothetical protein
LVQGSLSKKKPHYLSFFVDDNDLLSAIGNSSSLNDLGDLEGNNSDGAFSDRIAIDLTESLFFF